MRRRVTIDLRATTQARANTHRDALTAALGTLGVVFRDRDPITENTDDGWVAKFDLRFTFATDADTVFAALRTRLQTNAQVAAGSFIQWHDCTHDDPVPQPCVIGARVVR